MPKYAKVDAETSIDTWRVADGLCAPCPTPVRGAGTLVYCNASASVLTRWAAGCCMGSRRGSSCPAHSSTLHSLSFPPPPYGLHTLQPCTLSPSLPLLTVCTALSFPGLSADTCSPCYTGASIQTVTFTVFTTYAHIKCYLSHVCITHTHTHTHAHAHAHTRMHADTGTHAHAHTYTRTHTRMYVYACVNACDLHKRKRFHLFRWGSPQNCRTPCPGPRPREARSRS